MPSAQLKSFAKKSGKSMADLERYWDEAKKESKEKFGSKKAKGFWPYVVGIVERRAGLRKVHEHISFTDFVVLESRMDAEGWYVEKNDKMIEGPMEESEADARVKELGGDAKGYSKTYQTDYALRRQMDKD